MKQKLLQHDALIINMKSRLHWFTLFIIVLTWAISGCTPKKELTYGEMYVRQAFDSIRVYSRHRSAFNMDSLEVQVLRRISDTASLEAIVKELANAIKSIDRHNYILTSEKLHQMETGANPEVLMNPYPYQFNMLQQKYALVSLKGFIGVDSVSAKHYTDSLQRGIRWLYYQQPKGWIIDLRHNSGGWIYPMIAGLGPILGPGIKSYEMSEDSVLNEYYFYKDDSNYLLLSDSVWFFEKQLPVAVLISEETGSAGELLTLSFRGNLKTALIGTATAGVSTGLHGFVMPDGTQICVTNCVMADRNKKGDGKKIQPEIETYETSDLFEQAFDWIESN